MKELQVSEAAGCSRRNSRRRVVWTTGAMLLGWASLWLLAELPAWASDQPSTGVGSNGGVEVERVVDDAAQSEVLAALPVASRSPFEYGPVLRSRELRGLRPGVVARIFSTDTSGELPVEVLAVPFESGSPDVAAVAIFVEIDGAAFLGNNQARVARVEVYVYVLSNGSRVAAHLGEVFAVDIGELGETIWQSGLKFYGNLELAPGVYEVRALVRNDASGAQGVKRVQLVVPGEDSVPSLAPLTFRGPASRDSWLPVRGASLAGDEGAGYPFLVDGQAVSPAARAVLVAGREMRAILFDGAAPKVPPAGAAATIEFMREPGTPRDGDAEAGEVIATEATWHQIPGDGESGSAATEISFIPPQATPGMYLARLAVGGATGARSPWTPVALIGAATQERDLLWSDLRWMLRGRVDGQGVGAQAAEAAEAAESTEALSRRERSGRAVRRLSERYRRVLALVRSDSLEQARAALFELESEVVGRGERQAALRLRTAELSVAEKLGQHSVEALLPLVRLHSDVGEQYRARRIFSLVAHARAMVELLAEEYVRLGGSASVGARVLASQGGYRQRANLLSSSRRLFVRALEHDPGTASALLGLAASFEKYAEYNLAIEYLQLLVSEQPDSDEARLRLAINQARVGWVPRSRQSLETIRVRDSGEWVGELAAEELARIEVLAGNLAEARALLEAARERRPGAAGIRLLLAHVYDRQGLVDRSLEVLAGIGTDRSERPSARRRYDEWPIETLDEDRRLLNNRAGEATPALAAALEEIEGG